MKIKMNNNTFMYSLFIILFSLIYIKCDITIYPDHISPGDPIFNTSQVYDTTYERFYYSLGYYTDKRKEIYSRKYGIYYDYVKCSSTSLISYSDNSNIFVGISNIIEKKDSTIIKKKNYFEEIELFKNVMTGFNIECNSNLKVIHDKNLRVTYIIPVISISNTDFTIDVKKADGEYFQICNLKLEANKLKIVQIYIKTEIENVLNQEVTMVFSCTDTIVNTNIKMAGDKYFTFVFNKDITSSISLSNYRITVEDLFSKTGISYNKELDRSKIGLTNQQSCKTSFDCFRGHICTGFYCRKCHYSCIECNQPSDLSSCTKCGPLTDNHENYPRSGMCPLNYIDLSQFKDIEVKILPSGKEFHDRATIGLWLFFADLTNSRSLTNDIYHIVLVDRMVISIVPGDNVLTTYCHAYEDLYRKVTSDTFLHSNYLDKSSEYVVSGVIPSDNQIGRLDIETMNGKWFHISCGISFYHEKLYLKTMVNGQMELKEKNLLKKEKLYPGSGLTDTQIENDVYYNHIINDGEYLYLKLKNFGNSKAKIYARHLMFFKEFIPIELQYMYFNFKDEINYKEILYQIPFDELFIQSGYSIKGYQYDGSGIESSNIILEISHSDMADFSPPLNFYRLILNKPNKKYTRIDLNDTSNTANIEIDLDKTSTDPNYQYLYDDNKLLYCKENYFYNDDNGIIECTINSCKNGFSIYPEFIIQNAATTTKRNTGYCFKCAESSKCNQDFSSKDDFDFDKHLYCKEVYPNSYNLFYTCPNQKYNYHDYYLQYSGFYNSQTIEFKLDKPLKSYIIEFWFYPDFFLRAQARKSQFNYPTYTKNFFFHSNVIDCYFSQTDRLVPYIYDSYKIIKIETFFNSNEWNKFIIVGKYYILTQDYSKTVFVNHAFDQPFAFDMSKESKATILQTITFCENKCQDINSENIHWTTGYYRDLRIWDGDMASYSQVIQYNEIYPDYKLIKRVFSILYFFPFSNEYIANNKIIDPKYNYKQFSITTGNYNLKKYNYGWKFDIIKAKGEDGYYSKHATDPAFIDSCDNGCKRCWERSFCYECMSTYFLSGRKCVPINQNYYFRNPTEENIDISLEYDDKSAITICFWTKPIGFENEKNLIITLGSSPNLRLYFSSIEDEPVYGLSLLGNGDTDDKNNIIGNEREFRDNIGKWTFISVAYHKKLENIGITYFPRMIKFEINTDSITADPEKIGSDPTFDKIIIDKGYFGLFFGIRYYTEYIIQSITYENDDLQIQNPFSVPQLQRPKNEDYEIGLKCDQSSGKYIKLDKKYKCVPDEKPDVSLFLETCSLYKDTLTTTNSCLNLCSGNGWKRCTCSARNHNSQMIYKNENKNFCRPLDYINFSRIKKIEHGSLKAANIENKCTMQFWMFAYAYKPDIFQGITFEWTGHNKIKVQLNSGYQYKFICSPNTPDTNIEINININQWIFLSCAVDYKNNNKIYINYNTQDNEVYLSSNIVSGSITVISSKLIIEDNTEVYEDWGYLFFRQIRLWNDAFFNAEFLSRILIKTPSKFPNLLHSWEPVYSGMTGDNYKNNFNVEDIVESGNPIYVEYQTDYQSINGMNIIDGDKYYLNLTMCSEDGYYFDVTLKKCLQFLDLSKMSDFSFKDLPSAYSGNYAMAFWIFFEDSTKYGTKGLHFQWSRHMQITIKNNGESNGLKGYCFPQAYYTDYEDNDSDFQSKYDNALNKVNISLVNENDSENGVWIWVLCSISYYQRYFFLNGNREEVADSEIIPEALIEDSDGNILRNTSYPMRFYLSDLNNNVMYKSSLSIININKDKKLYLREILLFRNYIPLWYSKRFKYMNMKMLTDNQLPDLLFVVNFADFNLQTKNLKYIYFDRKVGSNSYARVDTSMYLSVRNSASTFELSANFKFQSLCDLSTIEFKKYNTNTNLCEAITNCVLEDIHATYCMEENMPLSCQSGYVFSLDSKDENTAKIACIDKCNVNHQNEFLTPGTPRDRGICNTFCPYETISITSDGLCASPPRLMNCGNGYIRIGYKCIPKEKNDISALFFSKCYNSPNFYRTISTSTLTKISSGYFYEFWIKLDNQLIGQKTCKEAGTSSKEYYLYSTPHSIYKDNDENAYYYQIINSAYKIKLSQLDLDLWNVIVIETIISSTGQNVYVHINFEKEIQEILSISSSISMRLQYISFCSRKTAGDCIPGSSNIMWASAYYRNIRVWDKRSSSIQTIQDYNNGIYSEKPKSLVLFYPLTIDNIDYNIIKETISGDDNLIVTHLSSNNFQSDDNVINYNYELNLDWDFKHQCIEPYDAPLDRKILVKEDCIQVTNYYLKVPSSTTALSFDIRKIDELPYEAYTFCIYMKFIGILSSSTSAQPIIFSFKDDTFIVYDISTSYLIFYIGGSEIEAFRDTNFHDYIGIWTPICIANLRSKDTYIHPHMISLNVNKIDIPFTSGYSIAKDGIHFSRIAIGNEIVAYFADFRVYNRFIQGNFGTIISSITKTEDLLFNYPLTCENDDTIDCVVDAIFTDQISMKPCCVGDYNIYENNTLMCNNDKQYFDTGLPNDKTCDDCNDYCKTLCFNSKNDECTCDMTETVYWLRKNKATSKTYCEHPPFIDYSILSDVSIKVPSSSTNESTIEFWFYIYSYNTTTVNFKEINIVWDKHNRVQIINEKNSLSAKCYALWDSTNESKFEELVQTLSVTAFGWTSIRCGSNINLPEYKHFFNTYEKTISIRDEYLPYDRWNQPTNLLIYNNPLSPPSYGFLFIRELKLWQQYNVNYIDTSYINLDLESVQLYNSAIFKSEGKYPGLISLIRSEFDIEDYEDAIIGKYHTRNLMISEDDIDYPREIELTRSDNYIGYNLIDPTNANYYKTLVLCDEGWVYNSLNDYCEQLSYTKCHFPGDTKDTCIRCPDEQIYIHPVDGLCKDKCPTGYYKRDDMNQCRPCEATCYECSWMFEFNCTACIGERYLYEDDHRCVLKCEDYNLTASNITDNLCTEFYAHAMLINYEEFIPIDLNTFEKLIAKVYNYSSRGYTVEWGFDAEKTREVNNNSSMTFPKESPYIGDITKEEVLVDNSFFELGKDYIVTITVIAHNILYYDATVSQTIPFHLRINSFPVNGTLFVFPDTGLYRVTYFVIRCEKWSDDTSEKKNLQYRFYSREENTATINNLRGWSKENEISTNFSVIYYQQESSNIFLHCDIRDEFNATYTANTKIKIIQSLLQFNLSKALSNYSLPAEEEKSKTEYDVLLYHRSQYLLSLANDVYKTAFPSFLQTKFESALDGTEVRKEDPTGIDEYCNSLIGNGNWTLVDEFIICHCNESWTGKYCHINQNGQSQLEYYYNELFTEIRSNLKESLSWYQFMVVYNLFKGASLFFNNTEFFSKNLYSFIDYAMKSFSDSISNNTMEYLEILDFYYSYEMMRMEKLRADNQITTNNIERNITLNDSQMTEFKQVFEELNTDLLSFMTFLANQNAVTRRTMKFISDNYYLAVIPLNPSFDDKKFFEERKSIYRTYVDFMTCLNYIEIEKFSTPYYQAYLLYIEYNFLPFGYNNTILDNNTSPLIEIRFIDSTTGKEISISGCEKANQLIFHMPFTNYRFLKEFNLQKLFYDPNIYKSPDDPIFSDPIYIEENGFISNDTIEQRIEKYSRRYNISPRYYDNGEFYLDGITYINFTNDLNFIEYGSTHLTRFTTFIIPNNATYHPNGRFYYIARPRILKWFPNYYQSYGSLVFLAFFIFYIFFLIICICYDSQYTSQEGLLEYIKREIVKNFFPYAKNKDDILEKLIPSKMNLEFKPEIKFGPEARINPNDRILSTLGQEGINEKLNKLSLNKRNIINKDFDLFSEEEEEKNNEKATSKRDFNKKVSRKKKINNFMKEKPITIQKREEQKKNKKKTKNCEDDYNSEIDREIGNVNRATFTIKHLPKDFEKSKEERERRIENYAHLKLTSRHFFNANYKLRATLINSLGNVSLFQPRWKKLTMFLTEIGLMILVISIMLTFDEKAKLSNGLIIFGYLFAYGLTASTFSNLMMYFIAIFFHFPQQLANRLYKFVLFNGQLIVLKEWEAISFEQGIKSIPGVIICVIIWIISLYVGLGFTAVWKDQNYEFLISFGFAFIINFFVMELIVEGFIAIIYIGRKKYDCIKRFGFMLNILRNYRCLSP